MPQLPVSLRKLLWLRSMQSNMLHSPGLPAEAALSISISYQQTPKSRLIQGFLLLYNKAVNENETEDIHMANLIVYYSRKGQNYWNGSIVDLAKGNTERVAEFIQKAVGGDLFEIETVREYSKDYMTCTEEAKAELRENARPELKEYLDSIDQYDTIFVGYPNWWGTMPMCVYTFLEHYDLTGKKIVPFCTNEGSGMGGSERELKKICKGAEIASGLSIHGAEAAKSEGKVAAWAKKNV